MIHTNERQLHDMKLKQKETIDIRTIMEQMGISKEWEDEYRSSAKKRLS
ncbi:hypothetical protein ACFOLF_10725 [Paenibacillus sepulcri]|uniref:Fur-regulated basic protein FbpA n=1 Tax=Paenibacillus sepulcri TaxID=359917 RepID=A0ABS7BXY4_9BACL|nr:hypothetical protein [Paenibacillus sepulcri]